MKAFLAFLKKDCLEQMRTGRLILFFILFCLFGIMNPAIAKLTPWLMETMADSLAESGFLLTDIEVTAMTSWSQFYKNVPLLLIIFLVMTSTILTQEYQKGTLINMVTKGLKRYQIILSKLTVMVSLWTVGYLVCFGITYGYNAYFWDNSIAENIAFSAFCFYLFGLWLITVSLVASAVFSGASSVLLAAGAAFGAAYIAGMFPASREYSPSLLLSSAPLLTGAVSGPDCLAATGVTILFVILNVLVAVLFFNRKTI